MSTGSAGVTPKAPGALGFKTFCPSCQKLVDVRAEDGVFRYPEHMFDGTFFWGIPVPPTPCAKSDTPWEPT